MERWLLGRLMAGQMLAAISLYPLSASDKLGAPVPEMCRHAYKAYAEESSTNTAPSTMPIQPAITPVNTAIMKAIYAKPCQLLNTCPKD